MAFIGNAARLATSDDFRNIVKACITITAVGVLAEEASTPAHPQRLFMAHQVLVNPGVHTERFVWLCATTPWIANLGGEVTEDHEEPTLQRVGDLWTPVATTLYPEAAAPQQEGGEEM